MRLVLIEWEDSRLGRGWTHLEDIKGELEVVHVRSVGWLLDDGKDGKTIIPHLSEDQDAAKSQGCGDMTIPTRSIIRIVDLQAPEEHELDDHEWSFEDAFSFVKANGGYAMRPLTRRENTAWMVINDEGQRIDRKGNLR